MSAAARDPALFRLYRAFARWPGAHVAAWMLKRRTARGKEDPARVSERMGVAGLARPDRPLVWLHAASVGEATSLLPLIDGLRATRPDLALLVTTGTRTSAELMATRLPPDAMHQYAPVDAELAVERFIEHWRPSVLAVVESELWPTMIDLAKRKGVRVALVSGRVSEAAARAWRRAPGVIAATLRRFDAVIAQSEADAERLRALGAPAEKVRMGGALKDAADPLPADPEAVAAWRAALAGRPVWIAASTHDGEERAAFAAHARLAATHPKLLTIVAPRHVDRADAVAAEAAAAGLAAIRRSDMDQPGEPPADQPAPVDASDVIIVDRLGELGLWFRLAEVAFVGGSLAPVGGHNPLEAARLDRPVLMGPETGKTQAAVDRLEAAGALRVVADADALGDALAALLSVGGAAPAEARAMTDAARRAIDALGDPVAAHLQTLSPLLPDTASIEAAARARA